MSEYQKMKARALAAQELREKEIQRELDAKAEQVKARKRAEDERQEKIQREAREARWAELKRANDSQGKTSVQNIEYDPFAEEERRPAPAFNSTRAKPSTSRPATSSNRPGAPGSNSKADIPRPPATVSKKRTARQSSPPALGRKEKAAKALADACKRGNVGNSIFSIRPRTAPPLPSSSLSSSHVPSSTLKGKGKANGNGSLKEMDDLRALCPDRGQRDNRTIDQIQKDIKARKAASTSASASTSTSAVGIKRSRSPIRPPSNKSNRIPPRLSQGQSSRRRPSPTPSTTSESDSDSDSEPRSSPRKRPKNDERLKVSAMIQEMFRRPNRSEPPLRRWSDESSGSDMEARLSDVEQEEQRAIRIAKREDALAEREERERKARKEREKERDRKGGK